MTIREKLRTFLEQQPEGAPAAELAGLILSGNRTDPELDNKLVHRLLGNDPGYAYDPIHQRWSLTETISLRTALHEAEYVVVDLETLGGRPGPGQIIDIGAYKTRGPKVVDSFQTLVRPHAPVPRFISRMTAITNEMVGDAPPIDEVIPRFRAFLGEAVMVAHNAPFDFGFLDLEFRRLLGSGLRNPVLCTLRLARRLLPSLRRRGLDSLAEHFGLSTAGRHRGLGDARMTAELLAIFLDMLDQMGIRRLDLALEYQNAGAGGRRIQRHVPPAVVAGLPEEPGVYLMRNERGDLLYVGKARNLKQRVSSYFNGGVGLKAKVIDLINHVWSIETRPASSSLSAALTEARLIREHKPPYNRQLKSAPQAYFVKLDRNDPFPRLTVATRLSARPGLLQIGPFIGRRHPRRAVETLARLTGLRSCGGRLEPGPEVSPCIWGQMGHCSAPCNQSIDAAGYDHQVGRAREFLRGRTGALLAELAQARDTAARAMNFREAARCQRDLEALQLLAIRERRLSQIVQENSLVILEATIATIVLSGRLAIQLDRREAGANAAIVRFVTANYDRYRARAVNRDELEPMLIVARWLKERRPDEGRLVFLTGPHLPIEALEDAPAATPDADLRTASQ